MAGDGKTTPSYRNGGESSRAIDLAAQARTLASQAQDEVRSLVASQRAFESEIRRAVSDLSTAQTNAFIDLRKEIAESRKPAYNIVIQLSIAGLVLLIALYGLALRPTEVRIDERIKAEERYEKLLRAYAESTVTALADNIADEVTERQKLEAAQNKHRETLARFDEKILMLSQHRDELRSELQTQRANMGGIMTELRTMREGWSKDIVDLRSELTTVRGQRGNSE